MDEKKADHLKSVPPSLTAAIRRARDRGRRAEPGGRRPARGRSRPAPIARGGDRARCIDQAPERRRSVRRRHRLWRAAAPVHRHDRLRRNGPRPAHLSLPAGYAARAGADRRDRAHRPGRRRDHQLYRAPPRRARARAGLGLAQPGEARRAGPNRARAAGLAKARAGAPRKDKTLVEAGEKRRAGAEVPRPLLLERPAAISSASCCWCSAR